MVLKVGTIKTAWEVLGHKAVDIILCDVMLPNGYSVDFIKGHKIIYPLPEIILLTALAESISSTLPHVPVVLEGLPVMLVYLIMTENTGMLIPAPL